MTIIGKIYHRGQRKEVDVVLRDDIPYILAASLIPPGFECDELARVIRLTLPGYIMGAVSVADVNVAFRHRDVAVRASASGAASWVSAPSVQQADGVGNEPASEARS